MAIRIDIEPILEELSIVLDLAREGALTEKEVKNDLELQRIYNTQQDAIAMVADMVDDYRTRVSQAKQRFEALLKANTGS